MIEQAPEAVWGAVRWLVGRPRLAIRILEDDIDKDVGGLVFEVENRSNSVTSLSPIVRSSFYHPRKGRMVKGRNRYAVRDADRQLEPYKARILAATRGTRLAAHGFSWFCTYVFTPARGWRTKIRVRNTLLEPLSLWRFWCEWIHFRLLGQVKHDGPTSIDDYKRMKRFQGPH